MYDGSPLPYVVLNTGTPPRSKNLSFSCSTVTTPIGSGTMSRRVDVAGAGGMPGRTMVKGSNQTPPDAHVTKWHTQLCARCWAANTNCYSQSTFGSASPERLCGKKRAVAVTERGMERSNTSL